MNKSFGAGIYVLNSKNVKVSGNDISNVNIQTDAESLTPAAIAIAEARGPITISGNKVYNCARHGIAAFTCRYANSPISITANNVEATQNGIHGKGSDNTTITGNTVKAGLS